MKVDGVCRHNLARDPRFDSLARRPVIDWGTGTRSWVQSLQSKSKPIVELLPVGYVRDFPDFDQILLTHDQLVTVINNPTSHRAWHRMLSAVCAVYLILDTATGEQYVGSAYGEHGLLGRWSHYARTPHGGNQRLKAPLDKRPGAARELQFSVLQRLPSYATEQEVLIELSLNDDITTAQPATSKRQ
jgi:hypothetical protein